MLTGNKGEWSEVYALFKIIGDSLLSLGNNETRFPVVEVKKNEIAGLFTFYPSPGMVKVEWRKSDGTVLKTQIEQSEFIAMSEELLAKIKSEAATFAVPNIEEFMKRYGSASIKAHSSSKSDIHVVINDYKMNMNAELGFSIKSQLGATSTLLNPSGATKFTYLIDVKGRDDCQFQSIVRDYKGPRERVGAFYSNKIPIKYFCVDSAIFRNNLILIDSLLPGILGYALLIYYQGRATRIKEIVGILAKENPMGYDLDYGHSFYEYKIKKFLVDVALGMMPATIWVGQLQANGGYIIVKQSGELECYHIYNRNDFENYLLENTKFDTPSKRRYGVGEINDENEEVVSISLTMQIRFIS